MAEQQNKMNKKTEDDATLVWEFIKQDLNHRRLRNKSLSDLTTSIAYNRLADLLRLVTDEKVLDILDKKWNSEARYMVNDLRQFSFEGTWLDSIEKLFVNNLHNDVSFLVKLEDRENQLCKEHRVLNKRVEFWTCKLEQSIAAINKGNLPTTMSSYASRIIEIEKIYQMVETFIQRRKTIQIEIEQLSIKMKALLKARAELDALEVNFSSPTLFRNKTV